MGRKRAIVLGTIQVLMILHVIQWLVTGSTLSPVEPSEAMETVKHGIVNAGAVLFALALLSTVILGRYFCGWGCHVIMLQDFCGWMMGKLGIRPKPFRSRLLLFVPLILALYMFVWPAFYRLALAPYVQPDLVWPGFTTEFVTEEFWRTFPGLLMAVPFLLVCGFLTVYLLGAKGYCTYGCPYGGFFAPLDEYAVGRIRVTDACRQCGHCTAVCTSNVRVHEEVRDFRMVVDSGCMKTMDCVDACPNDALYFGFGKPAVARGAAPTDRPTRAWDLSWREEIAFAILAIVAFVAVRGSIGISLPLLFASGVVACVVFIAWKGWRVLREPNVRFHRMQLRLRGKPTAWGVSWIAAAAVLVALSIHSFAINMVGFAAQRFDDRIDLPAGMVFSGSPVVLVADGAADAERALRLYGIASAFGSGGFGLLPAAQPGIDLRRAWLLSTLGRFEEAETLLRGTIERFGATDALAAGVGRILRGRARGPDAIAWYESMATAHPSFVGMQEEYIQWLAGETKYAAAIAASRRAFAANPEHLATMRRLSLLLMEHGVGEEIEEGIALTERTLEIAPNNPFAYRALAIGFGRLERYDDAERALRRAVELAPDNWLLVQSLGEFLIGTDQQTEGAIVLRRAGELRTEQGGAR